MSRRRLVASLSAIACVVAGVGVLGASIFPLKAAPRADESGPTKEIARRAPSADIQPVVNAKTIWVETVKRGDLSFVVRSTGTLVPVGGKLAARVLVGNMDNQVREVQLGQRAEVDIGDRVLPVLGRVSELGESDSNGNRWVNIALDSQLPPSVGANSSVVGLIAVGKLKDVAYIPIPAGGWVMSDVEDPLFKIVDNGKAAVRVEVVYGRKGVKTVQVLSGLNVGDKVILSDMFPYNQFSRIEIRPSPADSGASFSPVSDSDTPLAGKWGYGTPTCVYCPNPQYSDDAYRQKIQGRIVVDTVVGTDGRVHHARVVRGLGHGLDEQAVHSVRDVWRFKPANGPDGKPAAVRTLIDVGFHLY